MAFPADNLDMVTELYLNGSWVDVSTQVLTREDTVIASGRPDEATTLNPGSLTLMFDNRSGDFSPYNTSGAYYGYLQRNTQIRVSVVDAGGTHYRFWGEVPGWAPRWDVSGRDVWVPVEAAGIWQRLSQSKSAGSPLYRVYTRPVAPDQYWPCEDPSGVSSLASASGGFVMTWTGSPSLAADSSFAGSDPLPQLKGAALSAPVSGWNPAANPGIGAGCVLEFALSVPAGGGTDGAVYARVLAGGTVARMDVVYHTGGNLEFIGYDASSTVLFDTGSQAVGADGSPMIVTAGITEFGLNTIQTALSTAALDGTTHTYSTAHVAGTFGAVTELDVNPGGTETGDVAVGHFVLNEFVAAGPDTGAATAGTGYAGELAGDRFTRLCGEESIGCVLSDAGRWSFETGTDSWVGAYATVAQSTGWADDGTHSLLITSDGTATVQWNGHGPPVPCKPGDRIYAPAWINTPAALGAVGVNIDWLDASSLYLSSSAGTKSATTTGATVLRAATGTAPATAAYYRVVVLDVEVSPSGTQMYADYVRSGAQMGVQANSPITTLIQECEDVDRGLLYETTTQFGLGYRTRVDLCNQTAAITLDYSAAQLVPPLDPTHDCQLVRNDVTISRSGGSSARSTLTSGAMSTQDPPNGVGRFAYPLSVNAYEDAQLQAIADWIRTLGTVDEMRYPEITLNLASAHVASLQDSLMAASAGDYIEITNLPSWVASPAKLLVLGFTETMTQREHTIAWNCVPESPYGS